LNFLTVFLIQFFKQFDFTNYLRHAYLVANVTLTDMDTITVSELDFLNNASSIIDKTSPRILQNYFIWRFMMDQAEDMPKYIRSIREQFVRVFQGTSAEQPRSITCGAFVNNVMGFAVSKLYIKSYFDENARNQVLKMIHIYIYLILIL
jgi:predicted metalloendopeptidase